MARSWSASLAAVATADEVWDSEPGPSQIGPMSRCMSVRPWFMPGVFGQFVRLPLDSLRNPDMSTPLPAQYLANSGSRPGMAGQT